MKRIFLLIPLIFVLIASLKAKKISDYIYYKYVSSKIENTGKIYLNELKKTKKTIYEISYNLNEPALPSWKKLKFISKKINFNGFILIKDLGENPLRWYGNVKEFKYEKGFKAVFTTQGPFLVLCKDFSFGKTIIASPVPDLKKNIYLMDITFFPAQYFFPFPDTEKPPKYSFLFKEEGPPILGVTIEAISSAEFQEIISKFIKTFAGIYLIFILFFFNIGFILKAIFLRLFLFLISFDLLPHFGLLMKKEIFHLQLPLPFAENSLELLITLSILFLIILEIKIKIDYKFSIILYLITSVIYLFLIKIILDSSNLLNFPLIMKISIFILSSSFISFWLRNLSFENSKYLKFLVLFFIPIYFLFPSPLSLIFLILGSFGIFSIRTKVLSFFFLLALWALIPPYIFNRENLKNYIENSYSFKKLNQTTFNIIKVKNGFLNYLENFDWDKEFPLIYLIDDKKGLLEIIEKKLSLKELPLDYKLELFEAGELIGLVQSKSFPTCSLKSKRGFFQESESFYHLHFPLYYKGKEWGSIILHLYFFPPYQSKKEVLPVGIGIYDKEKALQNSNAIFLSEKLEKKLYQQGIFHIYREGENYYLFLIPPWEFSFPYFIFGFLVILGGISSVPIPFKFKSIYFLILFPLFVVLFLIILLGFIYTSNQRKSLINIQKIWGSSIQKNVIGYIKEPITTFYYKNGLLQGGEVIEEKFKYCPSEIMSNLPLKKPEIFKIEEEYYLFFEDTEKNLMGIKQPNLLGMEKPIQWLTEKTWGNIMFFYGILLALLIYLLSKILNPIKNLSQVANEIEKGKDYYEIKPIFGKEIEDLSVALKSSIIKLQDEEKTLKEVLNNLPVGVALFEEDRKVLSNALVPLKNEGILDLNDEGIIEREEKIYQYKKLTLSNKRWIFFINDITTEIEKEKLSLVSNLARIVAHEIKNPLTPIKLSIEYLREISQKKKETFFEEFPKISEEVLESLKDLESISSEFSDFTRLPSLKKENINLNKFLSNWLSPFILSNKIILKLPEEEIFLNLDPRLFKRALINLLNNGWQSQDPSPLIHMNLTKEKMAIKIEIIDEGPGVPEEILEKFFEPYFTTKTSGTGLGLFISKKIIEEHKGKIFAENTEEKGLKITILFET